MTSRSLRHLAIFGMLVFASALPASAQEQSTACRLFPLACPGPTPAPPPPLMGPPDEQVEAAPPMMRTKHAPKRRHVQKHMAKPATQ